MPILAAAGPIVMRNYQRWFRINTYKMQEEIRKRSDPKQIKEMREVSREVSFEIGIQVSVEAKNILKNEGHFDSGRLAASIGLYTPEDVTWTRHDSRHRASGASTPNDAHLKQYTAGGHYLTEIGSYVEYASHINYGFQWPGGGYFGQNNEGGGRQVSRPTSSGGVASWYQQPFTFGGVYYMERATEAVGNNQAFLNGVLDNAMVEIKSRWESRQSGK